MKNKILVSHENDNIGILIDDVKKGEVINLNGMSIESKEDIKFAFKIAIKDISKGEYVYKYGYQIGIANRDISIGEMVHVHNMDGNLGHKH
jgi:altronate hydrolase